MTYTFEPPKNATRTLMSKGLVVLGEMTRDAGEAWKFAEEANLPFDTVDDSAKKVHKL